jgi:hypothetical protein
MEDKCSKCKTSSKEGVCYYHEWGETYALCKLCDSILEDNGRTGLVKEFMHDDHGNMKMSDVSRNILEARIRRANRDQLTQESQSDGLYD